MKRHGCREAGMKQVAAWIDRVLASKGAGDVANQVKREIAELCTRFPMPH